MAEFAAFIKKLQAISEPGGTMLDNSLVVWGNHMENGANHVTQRTPWVTAGKAGGALKTGLCVGEGRSTADAINEFSKAFGAMPAVGAGFPRVARLIGRAARSTRADSRSAERWTGARDTYGEMRIIGFAALLLLAGPAYAADTTPVFVGNFTGFNTPEWRSRWGVVPDTLTCDVAVGSAPCNWGYPNLKAVADPTTPGGGDALEVTYPAPSGPPSCKCGIGGAQLYQDLKMNGMASLTQSPSVSLKYHYKFPVGFDFGKNTAGKLPGLYGGSPGCQSGGQRCEAAWSARYMWRGGSQSAPRGEVYWYSAGGSGFGADLGAGTWNFKADGQWHSIEQLVNTMTGKITIWHDGAMVFSTTQKIPGPITGIFFSTFHGGHDTSWSPSKQTAAQFAHFTLSTDGPQSASAGPPGGGSDAAVAAPDGGATDVPPAGEEGQGGSAGGPGSGGSSGSGGAAVSPGSGGGGSGGSSGSGSGGARADGTGGSSGPSSPAPAPSSPDEPARSGLGCHVAPNPASAPAGLVSLLLIALLARTRRRRL